LEEAGIVPSMGRVGSAYDDNSLAESFVATLKIESSSTAIAGLLSSPGHQDSHLRIPRGFLQP
jgi:hypothetical protein